MIIAAYPAGDLILFLSLLAIIYYQSEQIILGSMLFLGASLITMIVTDNIYTYQTMLGSYASGDVLDLGWLVSYILIILAGIYQALSAKNFETRAPVSEHTRFIRERVFRGWSYFLYVWVGGAYLLLFQHHNLETTENTNLLFFGVGCIFAFVITRQIIVLNENKHLLSMVGNTLQQVKRQATELDETNLNLRQEINERNRIEKKLYYDALHDGLTGLANRILVTDRLNHAVEVAKREPQFYYCILFIDLDNFKSINDGLGHSAGDLALIEFANRLTHCTRSIDTIARLGGDEFVILIENAPDRVTGSEITRRIFNELKRPFMLKGKETAITCSIGIVDGIAGYANAEDILRDSDIAMYSAKESGKARSETFNLSMRTSALIRLETEQDLHKAIATDEFFLEYQPIYALEQNRIVGLEALVRWRHPLRGVLLPDDFIPITEQTGLIIPLGGWIINEACRQLKKWQAQYDMNDISVSINISGKQITQKDFVNKVYATLSETGLNPTCVRLEITENTYIESPALVNGLLSELREAGVQFVIDDFGTGYSSLGFLKNISVNTIKIDKSFVDDILKGAKDLELVKTIILMAQGLGMDTIAEGIESREQLQTLTALNCKYGQGFYLAKPMDAEKMGAELKKLN